MFIIVEDKLHKTKSIYHNDKTSGGGGDWVWCDGTKFADLQVVRQ